MNRGVNHNKIFFNDENREKFLEFLNDITKVYGVEIHAFCLMDNHYHLIIHTPHGNISQAMRHLNSKFAQYINLFLKRDGPLFRGRFKAILISADEYLIRLSRYIHLNPREAGITNKLENYKWSSYPDYLNKRKAHSWLITKEIVKRFGEDAFIILYKKYVEHVEDQEISTFFNEDKFFPVLGPEKFCNNIFEKIKTHSLSAEIVGGENILAPIEFDTIIEKVATHYNVGTQEILDKTRKRNNYLRKICILLSRCIGRYSLTEIAKLMGVNSTKTISSIICRANLDRKLIKKKEEIEKILTLEGKKMTTDA